MSKSPLIAIRYHHELSFDFTGHRPHVQESPLDLPG
jgi:hypothetical protein